jgi:branched-chain amino acid aminotransferase
VEYYNQDMPINTCKILPNGIDPLPIGGATLDEITRALPEGFYTTFTTSDSGTRVLGLTEHLKRLYEPARKSKLQPAVDELQLCNRIALLAKNNLPSESRIRLILARDSGEVFAAVQPHAPLDVSVYAHGVRVLTSALSRSDPRIKDTAFISASANQRRLVKGGTFEILLTKNGRILEGMTSNFYAVKGRSLITAREGILLGVTRSVLLRLARGEGMRIVYRAPALRETFDEAFLTSSSRGVVPIVSIDGASVGEGRVGAWTSALSKAYQQYVEERSEALVR